MGCTPTRPSSVVHPFRPPNPNNGAPAEGSSSDVPSSTPHQSDPTASDGTEQYLASELQRRLSHMAGTKGQFSRQLSVENGEVSSVEPNQETKVLSNGRDRPEAASGPISTHPSVPTVPARYPLQMPCGTDSQVEFFKMLEKKINEGPDYEPEHKKRRTGTTFSDT